MNTTRLLFNLMMVTAITVLAGCVIAPAPYQPYRADVVYPDALPSDVVTYEAPPAPQYEVIGTPPAPGYIWISGVWLWEGGRHVWHRGYWNAPRPGYVWVPHRWNQVGREWRMNGGHWMRNH